MECCNCREIGHIRRACPYLRQVNEKGPRGYPSLTNVRGATCNEMDKGRVYLKVSIDGRTHYCLLDTGCDLTLISALIVGKDKVRQSSHELFAANGTKIPIRGWTTIEARLGKTPIEINGLVSEHVTEIMLGIDWLQDYGVTWNFLKTEIHIEGETHQLVARENRQPWCRRVVMAEDTVISPRSQLDVPTKAIFKELHADQNAGLDMWATEPGEIKDGLLVARTLLPNRADNLPVRLMNVTDESMKVGKNTVVSTLEPLAPLPKQQKSHEEVKDDSIIEDMMSKVDKSVPSHIREELKQMLERYSNVFSRDEWDLGWTDIVTHKIDVGDNKPIRQRMRRYPPSHLEAIDKHLSDMLRQGVVEPASSPWASNIVLAKKKDGTLRCWIDYRQVMSSVAYKRQI